MRSNGSMYETLDRCWHHSIGCLDKRTPTPCAQRIGFCDAADGTKIAYTLIGSGAPILKAANWLNHLEFDWTTPIWGECFSEISRDRTLIRYDERGAACRIGTSRT